MSSEMRELIAEMRTEMETNLTGFGIYPKIRAMCDKIEALLARTEAGADGDKGPWRWKRTGSKVDVYSDDFTHDVALRIDGDFASEADADVYAAWLAGRLNTHPQDASGDAEDAKRMDWLVANVTETLTAKSIRGEFPYPEHKTQYVLPRLIAWADFHGKVGFREAIDIAMQAKEAK